jgi:hypothetical protein
MEKQWTMDHGDDEWRNKFKVIQKKTGVDIAETEFVFVLRPDTDPSAVSAILFYLYLTSNLYPNRNAQIEAKLQRILDRELS